MVHVKKEQQQKEQQELGNIVLKQKKMNWQSQEHLVESWQLHWRLGLVFDWKVAAVGTYKLRTNHQEKLQEFYF